jgi:hypothetical protein
MRKYLFAIVFTIVVTFSASAFAADEFNVLLDKVKTSYEAGKYQETTESLSKLMGIVHAKIGDPDPTELHDAGNGFYYSNVSIVRSSNPDYCECYGEITNKSSKDLKDGFFTLSVYDQDDKLIYVEDFVVKNAKMNQKTSFNFVLNDNGRIKEVYKYNIKFSWAWGW